MSEKRLNLGAFKFITIFSLFFRGYETMQIVLPATTDSRFLREQKIKSIGFLPVTQIDQLAHGHNEYMPAEKFLHGIDVMKKVLANMGNA